ncbi:MAG: 2Fe-2S iron-sulfur cluster-binding protein [Gemmatimonadaceae bacterium]
MCLPPRPSPDQIRYGLAGNLCRCTGSEAIYRAVQQAGADGTLGVPREALPAKASA